MLRILDVLGVELLLDTLEGVVQLLVVELVFVVVSHAEDCCDEGLLMLAQDDSVLEKEAEKDGLRKTGDHSRVLLVVVSLALPRQAVVICLVLICNLIEESVTVNREHVDDLLDDWLDLEEGKDTTSDLLVEDFETNSQELNS